LNSPRTLVSTDKPYLDFPDEDRFEEICGELSDLTSKEAKAYFTWSSKLGDLVCCSRAPEEDVERYPTVPANVGTDAVCWVIMLNNKGIMLMKVTATLFMIYFHFSNSISPRKTKNSTKISRKLMTL